MGLDLGTSGQVLKRQADVRRTSNIGAQPEISSFVDAQHNHSNAIGGGTIAHTDLTSIGTNTHTQIDTHLANTSNPHSVTAAQLGAVTTTGAQSVDGIKTFGSFPVGPTGAPGSDYQLANKKYVDDNITSSGVSSVTGGTGITASPTTGAVTVSLSSSTSYWSCSGAAFYVTLSSSSNISDYSATNGNVEQSGAAASSAFIASVNLPHGAVVTGCVVYGDTTGSPNWTLYRKALDSDTASAMASAAIDTEDITITDATIDNSAYAYWILTDAIDDGGTGLKSARISYTTNYD